MSWIVFLSKWLSPNFKKIAASTQRIQLVTISISHYCDMASWALKLKNIPFVEHGYAPGQHVLAALRVRVGSSEKHLSSSSRTTPATPSNMEPEEALAWAAQQDRRDRAARSAALPVAVCPDGSVWLDSWEIAHNCDLAPIDEQLRSVLDEQIGPLARQFAYGFILQPHHSTAFDTLCTRERHWVWVLVWRLFGGVVRRKLIETMAINDAQAMAVCRERLVAAMGVVDAALLRRAGPYLGGDSPGVGDVALAALVAPLVNPPLYVNGRYESVFLDMMERDAGMKREVDFWRGTVAGQFTMDMYEKHR
jgi:hypothetical protein